LRALPVIDLDKSVLGKENPYWRRWIQHPLGDPYWQPARFHDRLKAARLPVFHQSGWYDGDGIGSKLNYLKMTGYGHPQQKLTLGPWGHSDTATRGVPGRQIGPEAIVDLQRDYLRWFDHWLKGRNSKILDDPLVQLYVMGSEKWLKAAAYPLPGTRFEKLYLASGGKANTAKGDGRLTFAAPPSKQAPDTYLYDPGDPTPDPRMYEESEENEKRVRSTREREEERDTHHARVTEQRGDILVYVTDPLEQPLTIVGPVSAKLYAASSARDTDWFMLLSEVTPAGKLLPLTQGKVRARYRQSLEKPRLLKPGQVYEYTLDLWQTGVTVPKGGRLRVEVASAAFPLFSRNLNTGGHNETETKFVSARQTVYHDARRPSHILLPVIPPELLR
jgi:putative CocE/NonD family hydrolase